MPVMSFEEIFLGFLIALAAGSLIGLEREQARVLDKKPSIGGVRTFPLIALAGALSALLAHTMGVWPVLGALLVVGAFLGVSYYQAWSRETAPGITTQVAALITFLLGALALLPGLPLATGQRYLGKECVYDSLFTEVNQNDQAHRVIHDLRTRGRT